MRTVTRLDIIIGELWLSRLRDLLDRADLGYSVMPVLIGHGEQGDRHQLDIASAGSVYLVATGDEATIRGLFDELTPLLKDAGGQAWLLSVDELSA
jgi:hypothetical protein